MKTITQKELLQLALYQLSTVYNLEGQFVGRHTEKRAKIENQMNELKEEIEKLED